MAGPAARAELDDFDTTLAIIQLVAPIVFAKLTGMKTLTAHDRVRIVDDFLSATGHRHGACLIEPGIPSRLGVQRIGTFPAAIAHQEILTVALRY
ncbi:transcriptional regulator, TetR family [Mycobacterium xenopi 3993]|nr:transcriptional regulator, TetR family [Mycobacterium xenopi 3993]